MWTWQAFHKGTIAPTERPGRARNQRVSIQKSRRALNAEKQRASIYGTSSAENKAVLSKELVYAGRYRWISWWSAASSRIAILLRLEAEPSVRPSFQQ